MPLAATRSMKTKLPSLDKEGQAAAGGCCLGWFEAVEGSEAQSWVQSQPPLLGHCGPASPPQQRRGVCFQRRFLMHMKKVLLPSFLATCLGVGAGFPGELAAMVVRETEHGVEKTGRAVAKVGEASGGAIGKAGEKTGKASETVAKITARGAIKAGKEIGKAAEEVGRESGKAGGEVAKGAEKVGKGTVKVVEKISGKSQKSA
jgi:hypothetical protein